MSVKDYCSYFPEHWFGTYIGDCCKEHDSNCGSHSFYRCLRKKIGFFGALLIAIGGGIGCWAKYTSKMYKRL